jgi:hypothetical protein
MGDMEDKLMLMAHAGDTTSEEFKRLSHEVAGMRKTIRETDAGIEALSMTASQKLGGAISGIASGFELAQGAMGAFGANSEAVEQALLKVQSAMAIAQGVQGVREAIPVFKALKTDILSSAVAQNVLTGAQKLYNLVVGKSTGAMKALKLAIAASGVGALVMILMEAVGALDMFSSSTEDAEKQQKQLEKQLEETNKQIEDQKIRTQNLSQIIDSRTKQDLANAKLRGASEKELLQIEKDAEKDRLRILEDQVKDAKKLYLQKSKYGSNEEFIAAEKALTEANRAASQARIDIATREADEVYAKRQQANDKAKEANDKAKEDRKTALDEIKQAEKEYQDSLLTDQELELKNAEEKYNKLIAQAQKYNQDTTTLEYAKENELNNIRFKYAEEQRLADEESQKKKDEAAAIELEKKKQFEQEQSAIKKEMRLIELEEQFGIEEAARIREREAIIADYEEKKKYFVEGSAEQLLLKEQSEEALAAVDQKYKDAQAQREKELNAQRLDAAKQGFDLLGNLAQAFAGKSKKSQKRAFQIQKAAGIASATIDTYKAAQAAFASAGNPILGAVFAGIAVAAGLLNIKKIASQKFDEGGGDGGGGGAGGGAGVASGGGGGAGVPSTPEFNIVGNSPVSQLAQISTQPQQAYVVSGEVTSAQSLDRNRVTNATL